MKRINQVERGEKENSEELNVRIRVFLYPSNGWNNTLFCCYNRVCYIEFFSFVE